MVPWARQGIKRQSSKLGPINVLQSYAQGPADIELFTTDSCAPLSYLAYSELLAAFPSGSVPQQPFEVKSLQWQLQSATAPGSKRLVHLAVLLPAAACFDTTDLALPPADPAGHSHGLFGLQQHASRAAAQGSEQQLHKAANGHPNSFSKQRRQLCNGSMASSVEGTGNRQKRQQLFLQDDHEHSGNECALQQYQQDPSSASTAFYCNGSSTQHSQHKQQQQQQRVQDNSQEHERRKFTRNMLNASSKKESLERYKAIISLIESCKRRMATLPQLQQLLPDSEAGISWGCEPACSLLQAVLDVGEALASFGNSHFPEHSNEGRAILAGDYRALLRQYLSQFGFMFAVATKEQLPHDLQEEVQSVGSLLATRCEAYDLLYDQLVRHVGLEGRGGPSTLVLNHNSNSAAANPTTSITANPTNTTTASSTSKAKAVNKGMGGAAIAAAGLAGLLLVRILRGGGGGGGGSRGKRSTGASAGAGSAALAHGQQQRLRIPKGKNGRELLLVSQLSACGDELRRAKHNDELLKDDWRMGRHVRLAWPPGPPLPPGYAELAPDACNVSQLLQDMYG